MEKQSLPNSLVRSQIFNKEETHTCGYTVPDNDTVLYNQEDYLFCECQPPGLEIECLCRFCLTETWRIERYCGVVILVAGYYHLRVSL